MFFLAEHRTAFSKQLLEAFERLQNCPVITARCLFSSWVFALESSHAVMCGNWG